MGRDKTRFFSHWRQRAPDQTSYTKFVKDTGLKYEKIYNMETPMGMAGTSKRNFVIQDEISNRGYSQRSSNLLKVTNGSTRPGTGLSRMSNSNTTDSQFPTIRGFGDRRAYNGQFDNQVHPRSNNWRNEGNENEMMVKNNKLAGPNEITAGFFRKKEKPAHNDEKYFENDLEDDIPRIQRELIKKKAGTSFNYFPVDDHLNDLKYSLKEKKWYQRMPMVEKVQQPYVHDRQPYVNDPNPYIEEQQPYIRDPKSFFQDQERNTEDKQPYIEDQQSYIQDYQPYAQQSYINDQQPYINDQAPNIQDQQFYTQDKQTTRMTGMNGRANLQDDIDGTDDEVAYFTGHGPRTPFPTTTKVDPVRDNDFKFDNDDDVIFAGEKSDTYMVDKLAQIKKMESDNSKYTFSNRALRRPLGRYVYY